ncbi:preprotein translocase subunit SecE [Brevibacterium litoralis]|uniref:preprotein translocase subunit SecE n=1 Tax=Brevibacterium litoralis TaxID=3138935 RepID=UPI0032EE1E4F
MADSTADAAQPGKKTQSGKVARKQGFFGTILQFFREVVAELKKVVTPTRKQLLNFTLVVLAFVVVMMLIVTGLDFAFGKLAALVFAGTPLW